MIERLFVYGTLAPNRPNAHVLGAVGGSWDEATVTGNLHMEGWGAAMGYPGIVLDDSGNQVSGFLFSSANLCNYWNKLDEFEGEAYQRILTTATLKDGNTVDAYIYVLKNK